jgi:citronellol/citronellal dehydrogenase
MAAGSRIFADGLLEGQVALVTGGGTGLGKAAARELVACGARVVIAGRRREVLAAASAEMGEDCSTVVGDIREQASVEAMVEAPISRHGQLDILVNNAGGQYFAPAEAIEAKGWDAVSRLNVQGTLRMARAAADRAMRPAGRGTIVNVTLSPHHGLPGMVHSSVARAGVEGLTRELAADWAQDGVTVAAVAAGHFETESIRKYPEPVWRAAAATVPLQRLGREEEHAWLIALLASPLGRTLSGSVVTLDGGRDNWFGAWPPPGLGDDGGEVPTEDRRRPPAG